MKKNKFIALALAAMTALSAVQTAAFAAAAPIEVNWTAGEQEFTVKINDAEPNAPIAVKITDRDTDNVDVYEMGRTDAEGNFQFTYQSNSSSRVGYMDVVAQVGTASPITDDFYKMSNGEYEDFYQALKDQDAADIESLFTTYVGNGGLPLANEADFDALSPSEKTDVFEIMATDPVCEEKFADYGEDTFDADFSDVMEGFYSAVLVEYYNKDSANLAEMIEEDPYKEVVAGLAPALQDAFGVAEKYDVLDTVYAELEASYPDAKALLEAVQFEIFQTVIEEATHWNNVQEITKLYNEKGIISVNTSKANYNVYGGLMQNEYSYETFVTAFNALLPKGGGGGSDYSEGVGVMDPSNDGNNVDINAEPVGDLVFSDLVDAKWAIKAVTYVYEKGIVAGVGDGKFEPNRVITRAEAAKLIVAMVGETEGADITFTDVKKTDWFYPYVSVANKLGIVSGRSKTIFDAHSLVTRQEMAVMAFNAIKLNTEVDTSNLNPTIADKDAIASWALDAVKYLYAKNIMIGRTGNRFDPIDNITRAEAATVIYNIIK